MAQFAASQRMIALASRSLAGGVSSDFRLGISPTPLVLRKGEGPYLWDVDGNRLIDYYLGMGPMILGHSPSEVVKAVVEQVQSGILFAGQSEIEFEAAELVQQMVPCAELVRFGCSGSEVIQAALRIARAATGRSTVIKFEGHYHGWFDNIQWSVAPPLERAGPRERPQRVAGSAGQDDPAGEHIEVLPWNDAELLAQRLAAADVAAVIMEPVMCNTSCILPGQGYLERVRSLCSATGTVLIFDEVITGFRVAPGGAQQRLGVVPDLATFGKAIANGFPVACLAGRADLMDLLTKRRVVHGGTYNAQAVSMAATVATLRCLRQGDVYATIERRGQQLMDGLRAAFEHAGVAARIQGWPQIFHLALGTRQPSTDYRSSLEADKQRYVALTSALLTHGVRVLERGAWFMSAVHDEEVIEATLAAVERVLDGGALVPEGGA